MSQEYCILNLLNIEDKIREDNPAKKLGREPNTKVKKSLL